MSFEDLPVNLRETPVPDLVVADLLDLFVGPFERRAGAALFVLCDEADRIVTAVMVDEMSHRAPADERRQCIRVVTEALVGSGGAVLIAIARPGDPTPTAVDADWLEDAIAICSGRVRLLGVHCCAPGGSREIGSVNR